LATGVVFLVLAGCAMKPPQVPSTPFTIRIPVADDTTTIASVIKDRQNYLGTDSLGRMALDFTTKVHKRQEIGDRLRVSPTANRFETPIGDITLSGQQLPDITLSMSALLKQDFPVGTAPVIPATTIDTDPTALPLENVTSVKIKQGGIDVSITNNLPVALENLQLILVDQGRGGATVAVADLGTLAAGGGSAQGAFVLDNADISGSLGIRVTGTTPKGENVTVASGAALRISAFMRELIVTEATAVIPQQEFSDKQVLDFPNDDLLVSKAVIQQGSLVLRVTNSLPLIMEVSLSLDDLKTPEGATNAFTLKNLAGRTSQEAIFQLENNQFAPFDPRELRISYSSKTVDSGTPATIKFSDAITIEAITEPLVFSRVEGTMDRLSLPFEPVEDQVDFPQGLNNVDLAATSMAVYATSAVGFRSFMDLDIEGTSKTGETRKIHISQVFERGNPEAPVPVVIIPSSEELTSFLNILPYQIVITPRVRLGDGQGIEVIEPSHWVEIDSIVFQAPARLRIVADTQIQPDPQRRSFNDDEARRRIEQNLIQASVHTVIENHLPIGVRVSLKVGARAADVYTNPLLTIPRQGSFVVRAAPVDANGRVTQSIFDTTEIAVTKEEALVFLRPDGVYTGALVELDATDGEVEVQATDYVHVQAGTEITMELNEDLVK
jgi:hypothetical protein